MATSKSTITADELDQVRDSLQLMMDSTLYNTRPSFSANTERYPDNLIPFMDKHLQYVTAHKDLNPDHYISNLKLMLRIR
jgi:hypothetical protein